LSSIVISEMTALPANGPRTAAEQRPGKRDRLVSAAVDLLHRQGVEKTTLADIAQLADVPVGNIYYYFKTKDEIVDAVVEAHLQGMAAAYLSLDRHRTPKSRLKALTRLLVEQSDLIAQYGCPDGTLCSELEKQTTAGADHNAKRLVQVPLDWAEKQFLSMGRSDAHDLALKFIAAYHGAAVLTHALREPEILAREGRRLQAWIDSIESEPSTAHR
jgi:TetR/AcrR family transcriptional repressor of nem operon